MFNLLIDGRRGTWHENGTYSLELQRTREYSDNSASASNYRVDIQRRKELPCLFAYERFDGYGRVGHINSIVLRGQNLDITYSLDPRFPPIAIHDEETYLKFGCEGGECYTTHWAVKDIDLFETVAELLASRLPVAGTSDVLMDELWGDRSRHHARVFLSHRAKDKVYVSKVAEGLREAGHRAFVAHDDIRPTTQWRDAILHALNTMTHFVGLVTDGFHDGGWTDQEVGYSFARADVRRMFIKLSHSVPEGFASFEQAATSDWDHAVDRIGAFVNDYH